MLSTRSISRTIESKDYDRLLRDLGRNGLVMPLPLRTQLAQTPTGAIALGLRRAIELDYTPSALTCDLTDRLLADQGSDGCWADCDDQPSPLLTAAACAALGRCRRDHAGQLGEQAIAIDQAYILGLSALSRLQQTDALFAGPNDRTAEDRLLTTAFIAYLMVDEQVFAGMCRGHELISALEEQLDHADRTTAELIGMARLVRLAPTPVASTRKPRTRPAPSRSTQTRQASHRQEHARRAAERPQQPRLIQDLYI